MKCISCGKNIEDFIIENGVLKNYVGKGGDIVIPDGVIEIGEATFGDSNGYYNVDPEDYYENFNEEDDKRVKAVKRVVIPDSVTKIGEGAFYDCINLVSVNIPDNVTEIGDYTFCGCKSLTNIILPDGVEKIGDCAFCDCESLTSVILPDSLRRERLQEPPALFRYAYAEILFYRRYLSS